MNFVLYELCYYKLCLLLNFLTYKLEIINFVTEPHWPSCSVPAVLSHLFCPSCLAPANLFTLFASYFCKNTKSKSFVSTLKLSLKQWGGGGGAVKEEKRQYLRGLANSPSLCTLAEGNMVYYMLETSSDIRAV
jgi:hypothetical protein